MPYIKPQDREQYAEIIDELFNTLTLNNPDKSFSEGEFNYVVSKLVNKLLDHKKSYATANKIIGVLECIKLEIYRRAIAEYETEKIVENGDI
jgi:hypothetical protein